MGYLIDNPGLNLCIYIPSVKKIITLSAVAGTYLPSEDLNLYFESSDCSGTPYVHYAGMYHIYKYLGTYYAATTMTAVIAVNSSYMMDTESCESHAYGTNTYLHTTEVTLPFTVPVSVPMRLEKSIE